MRSKSKTIGKDINTCKHPKWQDIEEKENTKADAKKEKNHLEKFASSSYSQG